MTQGEWLLLMGGVVVAVGWAGSLDATRKQFKTLRRDLTRDSKRLRRRLRRIERSVLKIERNVQRIERRTRHPMGPAVTRPEDLQVGDLLIHSQHGLGRYVGMSRLLENGGELDYLDLEYADGGKLHLPVVRLDMICRYGGDPRTAVLDTLGA
jgi:transcription-repair coupling factor (superfamily II helicase)